MTNRLNRGRLRKPKLSGAWLGLQAGIAATVALHLVLVLAHGWLDPDLLFTGLCCGVLVGPLLGSIMSGRACWTGREDARRTKSAE